MYSYKRRDQCTGRRADWLAGGQGGGYIVAWLGPGLVATPVYGTMAGGAGTLIPVTLFVYISMCPPRGHSQLTLKVHI